MDDLIERTEALIAKYRAIKQGLMHDLLTRGVDASGRLRPPREEAPGLYRESAVGWVPREWEVVPIEQLESSILCTEDSRLHQEQLRPGEIPGVLFTEHPKLTLRGRCVRWPGVVIGRKGKLAQSLLHRWTTLAARYELMGEGFTR